MTRLIRRLAARTLACCVVIAAVAGCFPAMMQGVPGKEFSKAVFRISGSSMFVRSDDKQPWRAVHITLNTDSGFFRQTTGDMEPGQVRELPLTRFVDGSRRAFGPGIRLESVWVQARYPNDNPVNELAFPAETFGFQPPVPPGG